MSQPSDRISVVIPCYRCTDTVDRAVGSVLAQTLAPAEIILVDDKSPDDTVNYIKSRLDDWDRRVPTRLIELEENGGPSVARNRGIDAASGEYIALLDSDDYWFDQKLQYQLKAMQGKKAAFSFHHLLSHWIDDEGRYSLFDLQFKSPEARWLSYEKEYFWNRINTPTVIFHRNSIRFDETRRYGEDHDFWCRYLKAVGQPALMVDQVLGVYGNPPFHSGGLSGNLNKMMHGQLLNIVKNRPSGITGLGWMAAAFGWSAARYLRRIAISSTRMKKKAGA
ncbi:glycosyltransferase family 2 protein [Altererythrobacter sp. MTPC7]|uniref:glycosyltransferase family 2 protein n=1 Tax=Altererythrobacter sp. MTPC7 TaxID=3056567 RepID=UPI0036F27E51